MNYRKKRNIRLWIFLLFVVVFLLSAFMLGSYFINSRIEDKKFSELQALIHAAEETTSSELYSENSIAETTKEKSMVQQQLETVAQKNQDLWGWVTIPGTNIDYPIMYTPSTPEYYLYRDFDRKRSVSGVPFIGSGSKVDHGNLIIHGHNRKDGKMFAELLNYKKAAFYAEHAVFHLNTLSEQRTYEIFAVIEGKEMRPHEEGFCYYENFQFDNESAFDDYMAGIQGQELYHTGVSPSYTDEILILSTCSYHVKGGRFAVLAREISETPAY